MWKSGLYAAVEAVQVVEAIKRIPEPRTQQTYYSQFDIWLFQTGGPNPCELCRHYETANEWRGDQLQTEFPYHKILDENKIGGSEPDGRGLVHPNCFCFLVR